MSSFQERKTPSSVRGHAFCVEVIANNCVDINSELDELDREEFYRLKKVSNKKQRDQAAADAEIKKKREEEQQNGKKKKKDDEEEEEEEPKDVLGEHEDDDVIF